MELLAPFFKRITFVDKYITADLRKFVELDRNKYSIFNMDLEKVTLAVFNQVYNQGGYDLASFVFTINMLPPPILIKVLAWLKNQVKYILVIDSFGDEDSETPCKESRLYDRRYETFIAFVENMGYVVAKRKEISKLGTCGWITCPCRKDVAFEPIIGILLRSKSSNLFEPKTMFPAGWCKRTPERLNHIPALQIGADDFNHADSSDAEKESEGSQQETQEEMGLGPAAPIEHEEQEQDEQELDEQELDKQIQELDEQIQEQDPEFTDGAYGESFNGSELSE